MRHVNTDLDDPEAGQMERAEQPNNALFARRKRQISPSFPGGIRWV